jgi:alpha-tubulin suppressor-like RCC1 family protein
MTRVLAALLCSCASLLLATPARAETIAAGAQHTVVRTPDGAVWTWGVNGSGQLGDGTSTSRSH